MREARPAWRGHMPSRRRSLFEQATNPERALADAVAAARSDPGARAEGVLRQALVTNHERRVLRAPGPVSVVAFAPRGGRMLVGDADGGLRVYSANGRLERTLRGRRARVTAASFSPDGALVLGAGGREAIAVARGNRRAPPHAAPARRRDLRGVQPRRPLPAHDHRARRRRSGARIPAIALPCSSSGPRRKGAFSPDGRLVATLDAGKHARVRVFDAENRPVAARAGAANRGQAGRARGRRVLAGQPLAGDAGLQGHVPLERPQRPAVRSAPRRQARRGDAPRPSAPTATCSPSPGRTAAFGSGTWRRAIVASTFPLTTARSSPSPGARTGSSWRMPATTGPCTCCRRTAPWAAAWSAISSATAQLCRRSPGARTDARCSAGAPTARRGSGTPSSTRSCSPWEAPTAARAVEASFDPAGRRIVSAGTDGTARIWSVRSRRLLHALSHKRAVEDAEFSPDGRLVVTASVRRHRRDLETRRRAPGSERCARARRSPSPGSARTGRSS